MLRAGRGDDLAFERGEVGVGLVITRGALEQTFSHLRIRLILARPDGRQKIRVRFLPTSEGTFRHGERRRQVLICGAEERMTKRDACVFGFVSRRPSGFNFIRHAASMTQSPTPIQRSDLAPFDTRRGKG